MLSTALCVRSNYKTMKHPFQYRDGWKNITDVPKCILFTIMAMIGMGYAMTVPSEMTLPLSYLLMLHSFCIRISAPLLIQ